MENFITPEKKSANQHLESRERNLPKPTKKPNNSSLSSLLGQSGEKLALHYLRQKHSQTLVVCNYHCRFGEIDIITVHQHLLHFVEVKTRRSEVHGRPAEAVHATQRARLTRAALAYLKLHGLLECASRFDVVEVVWPRDHPKPEIRHFPNAFPAVGHRQFHN